MKKLYIPLLAMLIPGLHAEELYLGSVPGEYRMNHSWFSVNQLTGEARVMLRYTWPDTVQGGDDGPGLNSVPVTLNQLRFEPSTKQVVLLSNGGPKVCATVRQHRFLLWAWRSAEPSGQCTVIQRTTEHGEQSPHRFTTDAFLEVN